MKATNFTFSVRRKQLQSFYESANPFPVLLKQTYEGFFYIT